MRAPAVVFLVVAGIGAARAESPPDPEAPDPAEPAPAEPQGAEPRLVTPAAKPATAPKPLGFSHHRQLLISARFALGLRAIATYEETAFCGDLDGATFARVCTGRAPFSLDLEVGYGVAPKIDAFLELRIGIEAEFGETTTGADGPRVFHMSPGARFFFSDSGRTKVFTTAQLVFDFTSYPGPMGELGTDFGVRNMSGLWFDLDEAYGFYVFVGETATFSRWLRFELEGGVGIQGRYR
jgi:hypothetical protein